MKMYSAVLESKIERDFVQARRRATSKQFYKWLASKLKGTSVCCALLACFSAAKEDLGVVHRVDKVFETVEVAKISGSVGRCSDFDRGFLPVVRNLEERWKRVDRAFEEGKFLPPVELYKLGEKYFVLDGNHRVSVARSRGVFAVDALVTEFVALCDCQPKTFA